MGKYGIQITIALVSGYIAAIIMFLALLLSLEDITFIGFVFYLWMILTLSGIWYCIALFTDRYMELNP